MNGYLKQATAGQVRTIGPFVDDTDFKTLENALTINNTDIVISINGAADTTKTSGGATAHGAGGIYTLTWDATDTASIGELYFSVKVAGALVVFGTYVVLDEAVYDAMFGTTALATATNITAGTITTVTNLTNLPSIPANWLTAAGIAAGALDGKGNWNIGKTGYTLTPTTGLGDQTANITGTITTATNLTNAPTNGDFTATMKTSIGTAVAASAVASVTGNVGGNVAGSVASVTDKTGFALTSAYDFAKGTTAMTEAYAANGVAPTPVQAIFAIHQYLMQFGITTTSYNVKKLDNTTAAFTVTLDDATTPSAAART